MVGLSANISLLFRELPLLERFAAEYAQRLGTRMVNVLAGRAAPADQAGAVRRVTDNLTLAAEILGQGNAHLLLEVINPVNAPRLLCGQF